MWKWTRSKHNHCHDVLYFKFTDAKKLINFILIDLHVSPRAKYSWIIKENFLEKLVFPMNVLKKTKKWMKNCVLKLDLDWFYVKFIRQVDGLKNVEKFVFTWGKRKIKLFFFRQEIGKMNFLNKTRFFFLFFFLLNRRIGFLLAFYLRR